MNFNTILVAIVIVILGTIIYTNNIVTITGTATRIHDKYTINVIRTAEKDYWIYSFRKSTDFERFINKTVKVRAKLSPGGYVCHSDCPTCQCPKKDLLYDVEILS